MKRQKHLDDALEVAAKRLSGERPTGAPKADGLTLWRVAAGCASEKELRNAQEILGRTIRARRNDIQKDGHVFWMVHKEMMAGASQSKACRTVSERLNVLGRPMTPGSVKTTYMREKKQIEETVAGMFIQKRPNQRVKRRP